jgi:hypothetical protein
MKEDNDRCKKLSISTLGAVAIPSNLFEGTKEHTMQLHGKPIISSKPKE